ncbi:MAG: LptF/LptG family permease [Ginsengibacter sp.]
MIKKLDKLILKAFFWPFVATFFISLFVLMMQTIWKYIDDLVGKGLDMLTLSKFILYASATMVMLALPIAILLSSIMTFGKLGESFELVAIKSSGIPLLRFMRPLFFVAVLLCGVTFLFANYIIPVANLKFAVLYNDIYRKSPAFDLKDGVFYNGFRGYSIKVAKKEKDRSTLRNVLIYEQSYNPQDNTVISESGIMKMSPDKKFLEFKLKNGYRYQEKGDIAALNNEFVRLGFKEYNKLFDLSQLDIQKTADSLFKTGFRMQNVRQLDKTIDSLERFPDSFAHRTTRELSIYMNAIKYIDSNKNFPIDKTNGIAVKKFDDLIPDSLKSLINQRALNTVNSLKSITEMTSLDAETYAKDLSLHLLEWHRKFSLSAACLVLFFIGAPLGSIIRKGGLGTPLVVAIIFFLLFHLLNMFGEKFAKQGILTPLTGTWLPIIVLTPIGIFLTYKATHDSQLFSKEYYYRFFKKVYYFFRPLISTFKFSKTAS